MGCWLLATDRSSQTHVPINPIHIYSHHPFYMKKNAIHIHFLDQLTPSTKQNAHIFSWTIFSVGIRITRDPVLKMSAYGHQMEQEYSARGLSSEDGSDMGSQFRMESVIYMSSFAATVFVGALVIVGVLLMTLLTALTVMLQSCQSREAGVVEAIKSDHHHHRHDYNHNHNDHHDYCKMAALNAEINNFEAHYSLPEFCKDVAVKYINEGRYMRELNSSVSLVEKYFNGITPNDDGHDAVLMDVDDFLPANYFGSNPLLYGYNRYGYDDCVREAKHMKHVFLVDLYIKLESSGWPLILLSRKPEKRRDATIEDLKSAGCVGWSKLIMRSNDEMKMDTRDYFEKQKTAIQSEGYHIRAVISSHMDMLVGSFIKTENFKLPNPLPVPPTQSIV
ncbi:putative Acid phosphatase [Helianthus annuus]|uniref:Acid phosphatase n=1 Tax=Helianthus annuus TaxID=4232 RepID=A0A9K3H9F0_HELAN|nr:putative Acid phosphatase [Helianthus annuus]KAJ0465874.1 putative Acid phosphatase [Helianthus annuus]KAJ0487452.1 putative Acid phosphatase [Helianthus annuus]KAJ0657893.1 putative Acid phosphatase [Helianthus annuus]KAJ0661576.1 putative Acid phosphatase [Helianthus annuus]